MEDIIDLSDEVILHKRFVEVSKQNITTKKQLIEYLEGFGKGNDYTGVTVKVSAWEFDKLIPLEMSLVELLFKILNRRSVRGMLNRDI